jgi:hypothetical protein
VRRPPARRRPRPRPRRLLESWPAALAAAAVVVALLVGGYFYTRWHYRECRHVGHSAAYCLLHSGGSDD